MLPQEPQFWIPGTWLLENLGWVGEWVLVLLVTAAVGIASTSRFGTRSVQVAKEVAHFRIFAFSRSSYRARSSKALHRC